jgi:hypothetical protein
MKILLGDFNAKVGKEDIFKPTIGNESLHATSNDNGARVVNFATSKNLTVKSTMFPHRNIHKVTSTSSDGRTHVARMGEKRNAYRILVGMPEGKRPLGRQRRRWVDNIKLDLREIVWDGMDWIGLAQDRDRWRAPVSTVMNIRVPYNAGIIS